MAEFHRLILGMKLGTLKNLLLSMAAVAAINLNAQNLGPVIDTPLPDQMLDQGGPSLEIDLKDYMSDPDVASPAVRLDMVYNGKTESVHLALFWDETPKTAQNFVDYIDAGRYTENFIHRSVPGFIIQGGGFRFADALAIEAVPAFASVQNEPVISNTRGTVAMAKLGGDPNSATSQWFINLANNASTLDGQNGGFTAFARVLGDGMDVADEIAGITVYNAAEQLGGAFGELPLTAPSLQRSAFIETNAVLLEPLEFSASSSDSGLVTVSVDDSGELTLNPSPNGAGEATVTVEAIDLDGATKSTQFKVTILSNLVPYDTWRSNHAFPDDTSAAPEADPDFDGRNNLMEYTFGTHPLEATSHEHFITALSNGSVRIAFQEDASSIVHVQTSRNLQAWTTIWKSSESTNSSAVVSASTSNGLKTLTLRPNPFGIDLVPRYWRVTIAEGEI